MGDGVYSVGEIVGAPGLDLQGTQVLGSSGPNFGSFTLLRREECYWRVRDFLFPQILFCSHCLKRYGAESVTGRRLCSFVVKCGELEGFVLREAIDREAFWRMPCVHRGMRARMKGTRGHSKWSIRAKGVSAGDLQQRSRSTKIQTQREAFCVEMPGLVGRL